MHEKAKRNAEPKKEATRTETFRLFSCFRSEKNARRHVSKASCVRNYEEPFSGKSMNGLL